MQVKLKPPWSALGWVTAILNKIGGSVGTPGSVSSFAESLSSVYWMGLSKDDIVVVQWRVTRLSERTHAKLLDEACLSGAKCSDQYMRNLNCLASELAFLVMLFSLLYDNASSLSQNDHDQPLDGHPLQFTLFWFLKSKVTWKLNLCLENLLIDKMIFQLHQ